MQDDRRHCLNCIFFDKCVPRIRLDTASKELVKSLPSNRSSCAKSLMTIASQFCEFFSHSHTKQELFDQ